VKLDILHLQKQTQLTQFKKKVVLNKDVLKLAHNHQNGKLVMKKLTEKYF